MPPAVPVFQKSGAIAPAIKGSGFEFPGSTSGAVTVKAPAAPTSYTIVLPTAQGAADTYLKNDGSGNLSWVTIGSGSPHNLLSADHPDTVTDSPSRGYLIVGNSTPKWTVLTLGASGTFFASDGSDPGWRVLVAGDIPDISATYSLVGHNHSGVYEPVITTLAVTKGGTGLGTIAADRILYTSAGDTLTASPITAFGRGLLDDADAAAARATLGLVIGTNVQAYHARLADIAGISWVSGDIMYYDGANLVRLAKQNNGDVLTLSSGLPSWAAPGGGSSHAFLSATHTDVVADSPVLGDLIYGNATPAWQRLAGNTTSTKKFLTQTGNGTISAVPSWGVLVAGDIPDISATYSLVGHNHSGVYEPVITTLAVTKGGTGLSTVAADRIIYTTAADTFGSSAVSSFGLSLIDDADAAAARTTLGLVIGTDVQAYHARLADIAGASWVSGDIMYYDGSNLVRLAKGSDTQVLTLTSGLPSWAAAGGGSAAWESTGGVFEAKTSVIASGDQVYIRSRETDGATQIAIKLDTENEFTTAGALLLSVQNGGVEKVSIDKDGIITTANKIYCSIPVMSGSAIWFGNSNNRISLGGNILTFRVNSDSAMSVEKSVGFCIDSATSNQLRQAGSVSPRIRVNCSTAITTDNERWFEVQDNGTMKFGLERIDVIAGSVDVAIVLGGYYLWVDSTGDLRINSSAPTSDTDGTVVGTQT